MASIPLRSMDSAMTWKFLPPSRLCKRSSVGISFRQGTHHVAQMFSRTTRPLKLARVRSCPWSSWKCISGTGRGCSKTESAKRFVEAALPEPSVGTGCRSALPRSATCEPYSRPRATKRMAVAVTVTAITSRRDRVDCTNFRAMVLTARPLNRSVDLWLTLPDLVDLQRAGLVAGHPRRPHGHPRQRDPNDLRLLGKQPIDDLDWDVTAD